MGAGARTVATDEDYFGTTWPGGPSGIPWSRRTGRQVMFRSHRSGWMNYWVVPLAGGGAQAAGGGGGGPVGGHPSPPPDGRWVGVHLQTPTAPTRCTWWPPVGAPPRGPPGGARTGWEWCSIRPGLRMSRRISYVLGTPVSPGDLYVVEVSGGESRRLTDSSLEGDIEGSLVDAGEDLLPESGGAGDLRLPVPPSGAPARAEGPRPGLRPRGNRRRSTNDNFQQGGSVLRAAGVCGASFPTSGGAPATGRTS